MKMNQDQPSGFTEFMKYYYAFKPMRIFVSVITFICQVALIIYLMVLPIQLAYHSMLITGQDKKIQDNIDYLVCVFFTIHIFLYFDSNLQKIVHSPNSLPTYRIHFLGKWTRLVTIQIIYDVITWGISIFMASPENNSFSERIIELFFFLKVYKVYKFHKKTIYSIIGTIFYPVYRIFFTVMTTFTIISYLSSIFYAVDYAIYQNGGPLSDYIFLINDGTQPDLVDMPFWVQLLMLNYWAIGTSSTAAYGDICGTAPQQVLFNIFILYFANFLYGYYLNNIQIIPTYVKQRQRNILQQFDHFQKYNKLGLQNKNKEFGKEPIDPELYLKILCSIEYNETQRSNLRTIQRAIPKKYIQQIKTQMYAEFFITQSLKLNRAKGFFNHEETILKASRIINQNVFQKDEDIYEYDNINETDLVFIHEGSIELRLPHELKMKFSDVKYTGQLFGQYCFITNQKRKIQAIALEYVSAYLIRRQDYKKCLILEEFQNFDSMFIRCLQMNETQIERDLIKRFNDKLQDSKSPLAINTPKSKANLVCNILKERTIQRKDFQRQQSKGKKIYISNSQKSKKTIGTQTQQRRVTLQQSFQKVLLF